VSCSRQKEYDVSAFTIEYPAKVAPMQRFVSVRGKKRGLTLMTYGIPEYELKLDGKGTIALTLLRCVGTLAASALITRPGGKAGWHNDTPDAQCPGTHSFRYALLPDGGDGSGWYELVNGEAERFHLQLLPVRRKNSGPLPLELAQLAVTPATLVMSACKMAEDGSGLIVRVYNPTEKEIRGNVQSHRKIREAHLARLDETILSPLEIQSGNRVGIVAPPGAVVTLHLQYPQHAATFRP
jgi:alpha-mannosidase